MLEDSEAADKEKARQLGGMYPNDAKADNAMARGRGYSPLHIAQILGAAGSSAFSACRPGVGETQVEANMDIPNGIVRFIIGRSRDCITSMR